MILSVVFIVLAVAIEAWPIYQLAMVAAPGCASAPPLGAHRAIADYGCGFDGGGGTLSITV